MAAKKSIFILVLLLLQLALIASLYFMLISFDKTKYWSWVVTTICSFVLTIFIIDLVMQSLLTLILRRLIVIKHDQGLAKMQPNI